MEVEGGIFFQLQGHYIIFSMKKDFSPMFIGGRDVLRRPHYYCLPSFSWQKATTATLVPALKPKLVNEDMLIPRCVGKNKSKCVMM